MRTLAKHENIIGTKDRPGDAALFKGYLESRSATFKVLTGSGSLLSEALHLGADSAILAVALFAPALSLEVLAASRRGVSTEAQSHLTPLASRIVGSMELISDHELAPAE